MNKNTITIVILLGLVFGLLIKIGIDSKRIDELSKYKVLVEDINTQTYITDNYRLDENGCYEIHFNYDLDNIKGWELYIDDDYSSDEVKAICDNIIGK